jgi:hypothetical protein
METSEFAQRVEKEMSELGAERAIANQGNQFAIWFGIEILGFDAGLVAERLHIGGSGDEKIDLGVAEQDVPIRILAQCKFSSNGSDIYNKDTVEEVLTARRRALEFPSLGHQKRQEFCTRYKAAEQKPERLLCVGFGNFTRDAFDYAVAYKVVIYDLNRILQEWLTRRDPARLPVPKYISIPAPKDSLIMRGKEPHRTVITTMPTKLLYKLVQEHGLGLFSENFRYKLPSSARSDDIAIATKATLESEPNRFLERNNGLTFIGESVTWDSNVVHVVGPQIVNGCQTSYAIHEWYEQRLSGNQCLDDLPEGEVTAKVIEAGSENARKIAEATNRQNPISARDLDSNSEDQTLLSYAFNKHDPRIFFEIREGAWSAVEAKHETDLYRVLGFQRFRTVNNEVAGQIMLALLGFPHWSKDRKKSIWDNDALNRAIFGIREPAETRFAAIRAETPAPAVMDSIAPGADHFIEDVLFGEAILRYLEAIRLRIYPEKLKLWQEPSQDPIGKIVLSKEYFPYWEFHVAALINFIIVTMMRGDRQAIQRARQALVGTDVNVIFSTPTKRAARFQVSRDPAIHELLDVDKDDASTLGHLSQWFNSVDSIFGELVESDKNLGQFRNLNYFFYKQDSTFQHAMAKASKWLGSKIDRDLRFPLPSQSAAEGRSA